MKGKVLLAMVLLTGCGISVDQVTLSNGRRLDYVTGKIYSAGVEHIFKDVYDENGNPIVELKTSTGGQSLLGQLLEGSAAAGIYGAATVQAAKALKPATTNVSTDVEGGSQNVVSPQGLLGDSEKSPVVINNSNISSSRASIKMGDVSGGGSGGGVPGCQKAKNGC